MRAAGGGFVVDRTGDPPLGVLSTLDLAAMAAHPRLSATVMQTVGVKGYDGFAMAVVTE